MSEQIPLASFISDLGIVASVQRAYDNPNMDSGSLSQHWRVTLRRGRTRITVPFSQGSAHTEPPTAEDVLNCLISDATGYENAQSFEDWCSDYGYDMENHQQAKRTYKAVERQTAKLRRLLGDDWDRIWDVESL